MSRHVDLFERAAVTGRCGCQALVEAYTLGKSLTDVASNVDLGLDRVSNGLFCSLLPQTLTAQGTL